MFNIERRIAALEGKANAINGSLRLVIVEYGETEADALMRAGLPSDAADTMFVRFIAPEDATL